MGSSIWAIWTSRCAPVTGEVGVYPSARTTSTASPKRFPPQFCLRRSELSVIANDDVILVNRIERDRVGRVNERDYRLVKGVGNTEPGSLDQR